MSKESEERRCIANGCERPAAKTPSKIEGGEGMCGPHRGLLASAISRKARKVSAKPSPELASIAPIENAAPVRVYIAAPKSEVMRARAMAEALSAIEGVAVVSRWIRFVEPGDSDPTCHEEAARLLAENYADIASATVLVALTRKGVGEETYCEIRHGLDSGKTVIWSIEKGGLPLSYRHNAVSPAPLDADVARVLGGIMRGRAA